MRLPFDTDAPLRAAMARGHLAREGHVLTGHYVPVDDDSFDYVRLVRTCCGEV